MSLAPLCGQAERGATVSGIVTDAVTHLPVEGATVRAGDALMRTDSSGAYTLRVEAGKVRVIAFRTGYIRPSPENEIDVAGGDRLRRDFALRPAPRISGAVIDAETGKRVSGCIVVAIRQIVAMGEAWYVDEGIPTADSRAGTFEVVGLDPGSYVLEITGCARTFYPDVGRIEMATPIAVTEAGVSGLTLKIRTHRGYKISGIAPPGAVEVRLVRHLQSEAQTIAQTRASREGKFEFDGVPEGEYYIEGEVVEVTDHDIYGVRLKPRLAPAPQWHIPANTKAELVPVFNGDPGLYWPRLTGLPESQAITAVLVNNVEHPNGSIRIDGGAPDLTFVVTDDVRTLTGKVEAHPAEVVAIREPYTAYLDQTTLPRTRSDENGKFALDNLAPGKYKIVTLTGEEELLAHNEKFLRRKADSSESVEAK